MWAATLEEASRHDKEIKDLKAQNSELEAELRLAQGAVLGAPSTDSVLTAPGTMLSSFARKVVSQLGAAEISNQQLGTSENLEESMRKVNMVFRQRILWFFSEYHILPPWTTAGAYPIFA